MSASFLIRLLVFMALWELTSSQAGTIRAVEANKIVVKRNPNRGRGDGGFNMDSFFVQGSIMAQGTTLFQTIIAGNPKAIPSTALTVTLTDINSLAGLTVIAQDVFPGSSCRVSDGGTFAIKCQITNLLDRAGKLVAKALGVIEFKQIRPFEGGAGSANNGGSTGFEYAYKWTGKNRDLNLWANGPLFTVTITVANTTNFAFPTLFNCKFVAGAASVTCV